MTLRQTADAFFLSEAAVLAGQGGDAVGSARRRAAALSATGLGVELGYSLDREPVLVLHMGVLYGAGGLGVDELLSSAARLRGDCPQAFRGMPAPFPPRPAAPGADMRLSGQAEVAAELLPLVGMAFALARCGELVYGHWWLRSIDAEKFVLASDFGLSPPVCAGGLGAGGRPAEESFVVEVWPADASGRRMAALKDGSAPSTTMVHAPFDGPTRLRLVDAYPISGARRRTDENLRRVFG